ncbi:MAG TPA: DUF1080 domain-containing protein, partial [Candidatus Binataceae bacterium]|nr:DUF1080 domain-containing protein [Candidatus Binataceae bacterium]
MGRALATLAILNVVGILALAQGPPPASQTANPGRGGRGIPGATPAQNAALAEMNAGLAPQTQRLAAARTDLIAAALAQPRNDAAIKAKVEAVRAAERELANARADAFRGLQASPNRLASGQVAALAGAGAQGGRGGGGRGGVRTSMPHVTAKQAAGLTEMTSGLLSLSVALNAARAGVISSALAAPRNDAAIQTKVDAVAAAELALANARADAFTRFQATLDKLDTEQLAWLVAAGGSYGGTGFTEPEPMNFNDHRGYVSLFDGVSLEGWDGNPKFWRVEGGAIVGESTPENPSGNTYIVYRGVEARDFTLKFEMKIEGSGGSGFQYRSKTGIPWLRPIPANVTANVGPVNL